MNIMYWTVLIDSIGLGITLFTLNTLTLNKWTILKDSQPIRGYQNNSIITPIVAFVYIGLKLVAGGLTALSYHKFRKPKGILNIRTESFL
jgi:hypothetical protein